MWMQYWTDRIQYRNSFHHKVRNSSAFAERRGMAPDSNDSVRIANAGPNAERSGDDERNDKHVPRRGAFDDEGIAEEAGFQRSACTIHSEYGDRSRTRRMSPSRAVQNPLLCEWAEIGPSHRRQGAHCVRPR